MQGKYFEDLQIGVRFESMGRSVTETDIVMYNNMMWVINPLHADREHMKDTPFGGMVAPAPFTLGFTLGLLNTTSYLAGTALSALEYNGLVFPKPVRPGDTLHATTEVIARRQTSKPTRGVVTFRDTARNQAGDIVFDGERKVLVRCQPDQATG
jgi:acyl dehydratase